MLNNYLKLNLVFLLFSFALGQSNSNVNGYVRDRSNGEPLGYVNVFIKGSSMGAASGADGYFVISNVVPGNYEIIASIIGYEIDNQMIEVVFGENKRIEFLFQCHVLCFLTRRMEPDTYTYAQPLVLPSRL